MFTFSTKFLLMSLSFFMAFSACGVDTSVPGVAGVVVPQSEMSNPQERTLPDRKSNQDVVPTAVPLAVPVAKEIPSKPQDDRKPAEAAASQVARVLRISVTGFKTLEGNLCFSLFDEAHKASFGREDAPRDAVLRAECVPVTAAETVVEVRDLVPGTYAVAVFHDKNVNKVLDKNGIIPVERFGFSKNPALGFGAPSFDQCAFSVSDESSGLDIGLKFLIDL